MDFSPKLKVSEIPLSINAGKWKNKPGLMTLVDLLSLLFIRFYKFNAFLSKEQQEELQPTLRV